MSEPDATLRPREEQVLAGIVAGQTYKAIAADLGLKHETVRTWAARLRRRLGLNKVQLAVWASRRPPRDKETRRDAAT